MTSLWIAEDLIPKRIIPFTGQAFVAYGMKASHRFLQRLFMQWCKYVFITLRK